MEIVIKGEAKEIAALLLEIEGRRNKEVDVDVDKIVQSLFKATTQPKRAKARPQGMTSLR